MKIKVTSEFRDKDDHKVVYRVGTVKEFDDERAGGIIRCGLGVEFKEEPIEAPAVEEKAETEAKPKPARKPRKKVENDQ